MRAPDRWKWLSSIGVREEGILGEYERRRVMLLNQVLLAVAPIPLILGVLSIWMLTWVETALATLSLLILILALWLNAKKKFAVARRVVTLGFILYIRASILIFGRDLGASPTYLTISLMVMVLFLKNLDRWILFSFIMLCFVFTEYYQHAYAPSFR